jgi:16S rRNA (cytosine1402-N4)-methyltransferase
MIDDRKDDVLKAGVPEDGLSGVEKPEAEVQETGEPATPEQALAEQESLEEVAPEAEELTHKPVLTAEVLQYLQLKPNGIYLDVTFGSGGHSRAILEAEPTATVIAMDWDAVTLEAFGYPMQDEFGERLELVWGNFALLYKIAKKKNFPHFDGILADFGTSQVQIVNRPGLSIFRDAPLDMRMAPGHQVITAEHVLARSTEEKLREIFWQLGEEPYTRQIAKAIIEERRKRPLKTTKQLAELITKVVPYSHKKRRIHPATRVFQALRLYVNHELSNISAFLPAARDLLAPEGRLVCISFHSLEDRLVKQFFKNEERTEALEIVTNGVVMASEEELAKNPSSRSAKLRVAKLIKS